MSNLTAIRRADREAARNRRMIDIHPDLEYKITQIAGDLNVSVSQLIGYLLVRGMDIVTYDELSCARRPWRSTRYEFFLVLPEAEEIEK